MHKVNEALEDVVGQSHRIIDQCDILIDKNQDVIYEYTHKLEMYEDEYDFLGT